MAIQRLVVARRLQRSKLRRRREITELLEELGTQIQQLGVLAQKGLDLIGPFILHLLESDVSRGSWHGKEVGMANAQLHLSGRILSTEVFVEIGHQRGQL